MSYSPGIPNATDKISQSQPLIKTNFEQLNTLFDVDHVKYDDATVAARGRHKKMTFTAPLAADPNQISPIASLYTKTVAGASELFFQNGNLAANAKQLTNSALLATGGAGQLSNGLQIRAALGNASMAGTLNSFSPQFPGGCVSVVCTAFSAGNQINVNTLTATDFIALSPQGNAPIYYIAIGF